MAKKQAVGPILSPIDFSPYSESALALAADLAETLKRPLVVVHVVHDPGEAPGSYERQKKGKVVGKMEDAAREMMATFLKKVAKDHPQLKTFKTVDTKLVTGLPVNRILEFVDQLQPYLVVMGSKGRTGMSRLLLGSKAEQLLRLSPVPVTIVKRPKEKE